MPEDNGILNTILAGTTDFLAGLSDRMNWAEDEISQAQERHPACADALYHAFRLLAPSPILQQAGPAEFVYRSHYRELLERVAAGQDTRPATDAEIACLCCEASLVAPLSTAAAGLYLRVWNRAFPGHRNPFKEAADDAGHYEAIAGSRIDAIEAESRRKLTDRGRTLKDEECSGRHHGEPAPHCRYYSHAKAA
jgi:hypothetical protein